MDKIVGNYTGQPNGDFPLDCETLEYIAQNRALVEVLGNVIGDKVILQGCALANGGLSRGEGYVFLRTEDFPQGEILRWEGGLVSGGLAVSKVDIAVNAQGYQYPKAYTRRSLVAGGTMSWSDFHDVGTMVELRAAVSALQTAFEQLTGEPAGIVKMWAGNVGNIPSGYALCDGRELNISDYATLYAAIGTAYNTARNWNGSAYTTASGKFRLPDLRGRFIVGYNSHENDEEYDALGNTGGEKVHTLSTLEMPAHRHKVFAEDDLKDNNPNHYDETGTNPNKLTGYIGTTGNGQGASGRGDGGVAMSSQVGGNAAHENRPPYYVLAYIIKLY